MEKLPSIKALFGAIIAIFFLVGFSFLYQRFTKLEFRSDVSILGSYLRASSQIQYHLMKDNEISTEEQIEVVQQMAIWYFTNSSNEN